LAQKVDKLMFIKKNLLILKKLFGKAEKLNNHGVNFDAMVQKGEKRSYDRLSSVDNNYAVNLSDCNDDE